MKLVFAIITGAIAACLFYKGAHSGGWGTDLGSVYYCYESYVALDAVGDLLEALVWK